MKIYTKSFPSTVWPCLFVLRQLWNNSMEELITLTFFTLLQRRPWSTSGVPDREEESVAQVVCPCFVVLEEPFSSSWAKTSRLIIWALYLLQLQRIVRSGTLSSLWPHQYSLWQKLPAGYRTNQCETLRGNVFDEESWTELQPAKWQHYKLWGKKNKLSKFIKIANS